MNKEKKFKRLAEKRKHQITSAAMKVFSQKGFSNATTDDIIKEAGIGKGTIYRYFRNKEELFLNVVFEGFDKLRQNMMRETDKIDDPLQRIETAVRTYLSFFEKNAAFIDIIVHQQSEFKKKVTGRYFEHFYGSFDRVRNTFREGVQKNLVKDINIDDSIWILTSTLNGLVNNWYATGKKFSLTGKAAVIIKIFFCGIVKDDKRKKIYERYAAR